MRKFLSIACLATTVALVVACKPGQKDPPFAGIVNRQDVDVSKFTIEPGSPLAVMGVDQAWKRTSGKMPDGSRVVVAVLGTGIDYTIEDLRESLWVNTGELGDRDRDLTDNDKNGYSDDLFGADIFSGDGLPYDWYGHDTYTAALISATGRTNPKVVGVAPNASLMVVRYLGPDGRGNGFDASEGIDYAVKNGAKVIYLNWPNGGFSGGGGLDPTQLVISSIEEAGAKNVVVVIPAGNTSNESVPMFLKQVSKLDNVLVVSGTTIDGSLTKRTNYGRSLAQVAAPAEGSSSYLPGGQVAQNITTTSVAAAYVTGAAALIATMPGMGNAKKIKETLIAKSAPPIRAELPEVLAEGLISVSFLKP